MQKKISLSRKKVERSHPKLSILFLNLLQIDPSKRWSYNEIVTKVPKLKEYISDYTKLSIKEEYEEEIDTCNNTLIGILNSMAIRTAKADRDEKKKKEIKT